MRAECSPARVAKSVIDTLEQRRLLAASPPANVIGFAQPGEHFAGIVADLSHNRVFVGRVSPNALIVIDTASGTQVGTISLAAAPTSLAITPDGASILVVEAKAHKVEVVSTASLSSQRVLNIGVPLMEVAGGVGGKFYGLATTDAALAAPDDWNLNWNARTVGQYDIVTGHRDRLIDQPNGGDKLIRTDTSGKKLFIGLDGGNSDQEFPLVNVFDVSNASAPKTLAPIMSASGNLVDLFADGTTGRIYTANLYDGLIQQRNAAGKVLATWTAPVNPNVGYGFQSVSLAGVAGSPYVFAALTDWGLESGNLNVVALDSATLAEKRRYVLPDDHASAKLTLTPNGRVAYLGRQGESRVSDDHPDAWAVGLIGAPSLQLDGTRNVISGSVFYDANGDGVRQSSENSWENLTPYSPTVTVYLDLNNNGKHDVKDPYNFTEGDEPSSDVLDGLNFRIKTSTVSGTYNVRLSINDWELSTPYVPTKGLLRTVTLGAGASAKDINFGITPGSRYRGTIFADGNGDHEKDYLPGQYVDDPNVAGMQVYIDLNKDGVHNSNEPISGVVPGDNSDGTYFSAWTYDLIAPAVPAIVRVINPKNYKLSPFTPAAVNVDGFIDDIVTTNFAVVPELKFSGTLYNDINGNGKRDAGEGPLAGARVWLDANGDHKFYKRESNAITDADGHYAMAPFERGQAAMRVFVRDANGQMLSMTTKGRTLKFADWRGSITRDIGVIVPAVITLNAFIDRNTNGRRNRGEASMPGLAVYLDLDGDGKQDGNEPSAITDAAGNATFLNLNDGHYIVRVRVPSRLQATTPAKFAFDVVRGTSALARFGAQ